MHLLVSVASADEVSAAVAGGADIIDAKDSTAGALGAVSIDMFRKIVDGVAGATAVSAAIGDAADERSIENTARTFAAARASFVKVGFDGTSDIAHVDALARAARRGVTTSGCDCGLVLVAYADRAASGGISVANIIDV